MKIFVLDEMHMKGPELLKQQAEVVLWDDPALDNWPEEADGVIVRQSAITAEQVARARKLRAVSKHGIGCDKIDLAGLRARGIPVVNTPGANSEAVAELAVALALTLARRVAMADRRLREGAKVKREDFDGQGFEGKTAGIIGLGNIGRRVAKKWRGAFDMRILGYDPWKPDDEWGTLGVEVEPVARLEDMLPRIDLLSIHVPLTDDSRGLIDAGALALMKPTAMVVSAARGGIIDETALYEALDSGRLWGAALDVFAHEPPPSDHPLFRLPTFVATPHIGAGAIETKERCSEMAARQLLEILNGGEPRNLVN